LNTEVFNDLRPDPEFQALALARHAGNPPALTELALRLFIGRTAPLSPVDGEALLAEAARQGDATAWHFLAVLKLAGAVRGPTIDGAWAALCRAAELGHTRSIAQLRLLQGSGITSSDSLQSWLMPPPARQVCANPRMLAFAGFIMPAWCDHLRSAAAGRLERAQVHDAKKGGLRTDPMRTGSNFAFSVVDTDFVMQMVRLRIARAARVEAAALEPPEILHYSRGEQYRLHVDFFHRSLPHYPEIMALGGQRIKTCLVYLNEDYEGGETEFPELDIRFRGRCGEALLFENTGSDGEGDMRTRHSGMPVMSGSKWLFSQWIRNRRQPLA
jgi:hypothetical protein